MERLDCKMLSGTSLILVYDFSINYILSFWLSPSRLGLAWLCLEMDPEIRTKC